MVEIVHLDDFKKADGGHDFAAYEKARAQNGETCSRCAGFLLYPKGRPTLCGSCNDLDVTVDEEVRHSSFVRCPHCGHNFRFFDDWEGEVDLEDDESVTRYCPECDGEFEVKISVSYSFTSPPMEGEHGEADEGTEA